MLLFREGRPGFLSGQVCVLGVILLGSRVRCGSAMREGLFSKEVKFVYYKVIILGCAAGCSSSRREGWVAVEAKFAPVH